MPLYNKVQSVVLTLQPILEHSFPHFKVIIGNNSSVDNASNKIQTFSKKNPKLSDVRKISFQVAKKKYVQFGDDYLYKYHQKIESLPILKTKNFTNFLNIQIQHSSIFQFIFYKTYAIFPIIATFSLPPNNKLKS
jgi:glycosyltransferase involved in cell wall biosynthesis